MNFKTYLLGIFALLLIVNSSCSSDDGSDTAPAELNVLTVVADQPTRQILTAIDENSLTFTGSSSQIDALEVGDILASEMTPVAPYGFLRKITAINKTGDQTELTTEYAPIDLAVKNGSGQFSRNITNDDILLEDTSGEELRNTQSGLIFTVEKTFDLDENSGTPNDQITFSGQVSLDPTMSFKIDIEDFAIERFETKFSFSNASSLNVSYEEGVEQLGIEKTYVLKTIRLKPLLIKLGIFPLVLDQRIVIVTGIDGSVKAKLEANITNTYTAELGLLYTPQGGWYPTGNQVNNLSGELTMEGEASLEGWIQPRYEIRPYGISGARAFLAAKAAVNAQATVTETFGEATMYDAKLKFTGQLLGKAQIQLFSQSLLEYETTLWSGEQMLEEFCFQKVEDEIVACDKLAGTWVMTHFHSIYPVGEYDFDYYDQCPSVWQWKTTYSGSATFGEGAGALNHQKQVMVGNPSFTSDCEISGYNPQVYSNQNSTTDLTYTIDGSVYTMQVEGDAPVEIIFLDENHIKIWDDFIYERQ